MILLNKGEGMKINILGGFIFIILGLVNIFAPNVAWYLRHGMHYKDAEPTEASLILIRLSGILIVIMGFFVFGSA